MGDTQIIVTFSQVEVEWLRHAVHVYVARNDAEGAALESMHRQLAEKVQCGMPIAAVMTPLQVYLAIVRTRPLTFPLTRLKSSNMATLQQKQKTLGFKADAGMQKIVDQLIIRLSVKKNRRMSISAVLIEAVASLARREGVPVK